ncbi:NAD(P)H-dependent flavin oxidoreductase [Oceanobacter mangrovi]|uniref:NAD(P)H-dependent flavin oxidoreductase n=1 Tax=Oceanobacter mangrovi TaxID=2862510 RepID=UPI001C8E24B5|nr:nitronate monooxygenase [Oceanobacter mangrovi]
MTEFNEFTRRFGIQPLIQAPMAGVATPELAAAVCNAGGLGSLGLGASSVAQARQMIQQTRQLTSKPFNVNVFCHQLPQRDVGVEAQWLAFLAPLFEDLQAKLPVELTEIYSTFIADDAILAMLLEEQPAVVSFHFGLPTPAQLAALQAAGIYTLASATSLAEARLIKRAGINAVIAQGIEAGGHRGIFDPQADDEQLTTAQLVQLLVAELKLPVIAAGGLMDGKDIRAMLELGASAAQLGTAFILCPESAANAEYRQQLAAAEGADTRLTPVLSGRPARGIVNRYIRYCDADNCPQLPAYPLTYDATKQLTSAAAKAGLTGFAAHWAGQGAGRTRQVGAADLVGLLLDELAG